MSECSLVESLRRFIGQTVTIFTTSGGLSGEGFTGVLASVTECTVKLITDFGAAPTCPIGSDCGGRNNNRNWGNNPGGGRGCGCDGRRRNWVGSVTEIPICKIASFTHNAV
ncbi:MAG: hypothetical protein LUH47_00770 [Clostridiales bacterium]|nr:hypothetical protein [Clostridiales bacterium]MCD8157383.1 hypothetical protein [Clostridiales bacterium]